MWFKPWRITTIFVVLDIIALIVQIFGVLKASGQNVPLDQVLDGLHIYMGGVGFQELFILIFCLMAFRCSPSSPPRQPGRPHSAVHHLRRPPPHLREFPPQPSLCCRRDADRLGADPHRLPHHRVCPGPGQPIPNQEAYQYCLDSLPMLVALVLFNVIHPGRIMPGKKSDMPGFRERRRQRKASKLNEGRNGSYDSSARERGPRFPDCP